MQITERNVREDEIEISIIIPVYNGEKFISRCIDSILNQTFPQNKMQVVVLNDGSTDTSEETLRLYQKAHPRLFLLISKENEGIGLTRNRGIAAAEGKYLLFLDQDDWLDSEYVETFYRAIKSTGADFVIGGYKRLDSKGNEIERVTVKDTDWCKKYSLGTVWGKIHNTAFLKANRIKSSAANIGEDVSFSVHEALLAKKIITIDYPGYNHVVNNLSLSNTVHKDLSSIQLMSKLEELKSFEVFADDKQEYEYYMLKLTVYVLLNSGRHSSSDDFNRYTAECFEFLRTSFPDIMRIKYKPDGEKLTTRCIVWVFKHVYTARLVPVFSKIYCKQ